jgi:hypothetical protein
MSLMVLAEAILACHGVTMVGMTTLGDICLTGKVCAQSVPFTFRH